MSRKTLIKATIFLFLTFFIAGSFPYALEQPRITQNGTLVKIVPSSQTVGDPGEVLDPYALLFNITVRVENVEDLFAWQVYLTYDTNILTTKAEWIDLYPDDDVFEGRTTIDPNPVVDDTAGYLQVGRSILIGDTFYGSGALCTIGFSAQKPGSSTLNINNADTILLDSAQRDIPHTRENGFVTVQGIEGELQPTNITISVKPTKAYLGETIHINGSITPTPVEPNNTDVTLYYQHERLGVPITVNFAVVKTQNGKYEYEWDTLTLEDTFTLEGESVINFTVWAEWSGDSQYLGDESQHVMVTVMKPYTILKIDYADETHPWIGEDDIFVTEAAPCTFNVTVFNVTDLASWRVKIYYPDKYVYFDTAWIPEDNVFGQNYTASAVETGTDTEGAYITLSANNTGTPFTAINQTALLFQFNLSAKFPTTILGVPPPMYFSPTETALLNSTGHEIAATLEECYVPVRGIITEVKVINPEATDKSREHVFEFNVDEVSVGHRFNVTIQIFYAFDLFAWRIKLTYNSTLLNATRGWFPSWNESTDVLYGRQVNDTLTSIEINQTAGMVNMTCFLKQGEQKFTGNGTLAIIEFEILIEPPEGKAYHCDLDIDYEDETVLSSDGEVWYRPPTYNGIYSIIPEFPSVFLALFMFMVITLATQLFKKKPQAKN